MPLAFLEQQIDDVDVQLQGLRQLHTIGARGARRWLANAQRDTITHGNDLRDRRFPVEIQLHAMDRKGLLRDVTTLVADEKVNIERLVSRGDPGQGSADLALRVSIAGLEELTRLLARLGALPGVISARRRA